MSFGNLISKILDFVNLGKAVVDGGPGVVLAVALSILAASVAELPILPYTHGPVELVQVPKAAGSGKTKTAETKGKSKPAGAAEGKDGSDATEGSDKSGTATQTKESGEPNTAEAGGTSGTTETPRKTNEPSEDSGSGSPDSADQQHQPRLEVQLEKLGSEIRGHRAQVDMLIGEKAKADAQVEGLKGEIQRLDAALGKLEEEEARRTREDSLDLGRVKSEIERVREDRSEAKEALEKALKAQSSKQSQLDAEKAEIARFLAEFEALGQERITTLRGLFAYLLDHLVGLALIGWVLGTMLSPLNRALLVLGTKGGLERQAERPIGRYEQLRGQDSKMTPEARAALRELLSHRGASFFIGRKIISKAEWDEIVTSYYRWAEASNNLILPLTVLGFSLLWLHPAGTPGQPVLLAVAAGAVTFLLAVLAAFRGGFLFENNSASTEDGEVPVEGEREGRRLLPSIALVGAFVALALVVWQLYGHRYALGSVLCWLLAFVAWFQGRKAFFLYRRRGADFILGRLITVEAAKKETSTAQSLEEVAKRTVASYKDLLDEAEKRDERVEKELLAKLKQALQSKSDSSGD